MGVFLFNLQSNLYRKKGYNHTMSKLFYVGPSFTKLHEHYAINGRIDNDAGSIAFDYIDINADAKTVWDVLYDMAAWPRFNSLINAVALPGGVKVGASGVLKIKGFPINITFAVVNPGHQLTWTGRSLWIKAIDQFLIEPTGQATVRLHLNESFSGVFAPLISSSEQLHAQHQTSLACVKHEAEARLNNA